VMIGNLKLLSLWGREASTQQSTARMYLTIIHIKPYAFLCSQLLASYFVVVPLREEAGMSLGTYAHPDHYPCQMSLSCLRLN
jgi:hypothetical protein